MGNWKLDKGKRDGGSGEMKCMECMECMKCMKCMKKKGKKKKKGGTREV